MSKRSASASRSSLRYEKENRLLSIWRKLRSNVGAMVGLGILIVLFLLMIYSFFAISYADIMKTDAVNRFAGMSAEHWFGQDEMGRDMFKRVIYGTRYSFTIAFGSVAFGMIIGTFLGAISGYYGGWVDVVIMRFTDVLASIPGLLLGMVLMSVMGTQLHCLMFAVGIGTVPGFIRMSRASVLTVRGVEFVEAARAIGMPDLRIIFTQVLPNALSPLIITATTRMSSAVLTAAGLSFLGLGITPPRPEWGAMISGSRAFLNYAPHLVYAPGIFIMLMSFGCALLGDGLRDALDPKLNK